MRETVLLREKPNSCNNTDSKNMKRKKENSSKKKKNNEKINKKNENSSKMKKIQINRMSESVCNVNVCSTA